MGGGERPPLRLRSRMLLAGAGSTMALVGAVVAVAFVGAGLVAFDAWPRPGADRVAALPLAPARTPAPSGAADGPADPAPVPATATGVPAAPDGPDEAPTARAPRVATPGDDVPAAPGATPAPVVVPGDPPTGEPASPLATPAPSAVAEQLGATRQALADATRETGAGLGEAVGAVPGASDVTVTAGVADAVAQAAETVAQALERLPG